MADTNATETFLKAAIDEATTTAWQGVVSVATEKFAEELAKEAMNEPGFREHWRKLVSEASQRMLLTLTAPVPPAARRRPKKSRPRV